ncbi:MAG: hypothetical protein HYZ51_04400 [Candidatus Doudnabacteria bacterium]|nr:hypothetical protein [Candidatus Doudnabacteria bacterium]
MKISSLSQDFIEKMKARLLAEKSRLETELKGLPSHLEIGQRDDENAKEAEEDEVNRSIKFKVEADLEKIAKALERIQHGTYGLDDAGRPIAKERLEALPWADKSI